MKKCFSLLAAGMLAMSAYAQPTTTLKPAVAISDNESAGGGAATATAVHFDGKGWWNYVKVLAADDMEGRETGSLGLHKAQEYVVEQLKQAGLEPAGAKGFYQPVHFVSRQIMEKDSSLALLHKGTVLPLTLGRMPSSARALTWLPPWKRRWYLPAMG
jgi:hypothetical protein